MAVLGRNAAIHRLEPSPVTAIHRLFHFAPSHHSIRFTDPLCFPLWFEGSETGCTENPSIWDGGVFLMGLFEGMTDTEADTPVPDLDDLRF